MLKLEKRALTSLRLIYVVIGKPTPIINRV